MSKINEIHICFMLSVTVHLGIFGPGILTFDKPPVEQEPEIVFEIEEPEYLPDVYEITEEKKIEQTVEEPEPEEIVEEIEEPEPEKMEEPEEVLEEVQDLEPEKTEEPEELTEEIEEPEEIVEEIQEPEKIEQVAQQDNTEDERKKSLLQYQDSIKQKIQKNKKYPRWALRAKHQGIVRIAFEVLSSGNVNNLSLLESSGFKELDEAALKAIKKATPFAVFPEIFQADKIQIQIDIVFKL